MVILNDNVINDDSDDVMLAYTVFGVSHSML
jgi:hypothetical protein